MLTQLAAKFRRERMPLAARRSYRMAITLSLVLAAAYGLNIGIPFLAPLFVVILMAKPAPPPGPKQLFILLIAVAVSLGVGLLLGPLLQKSPVAALIIIVGGLYASNRLVIAQGKVAIGTLLALGLTVVSAASSISSALASMLIAALVMGIAVAVIGQWIVYPFFPEDNTMVKPEVPPPAQDVSWLSWRATLIVVPAFLITLINPAMYLPLTVKSILLGREASQLQLQDANRELIGSTFLGGLCAVLVWGCLSLSVSLWFYFAWVLVISIVLASGVYGVMKTKFKPTFWTATLTTMIILLGAAVQDSANGKDVYQAFFVRMLLFMAIAVYAALAMSLLEKWRNRRIKT
ncbi:DUF2955 domain-containing protein [Gilvimarinus sp. SDUM040013]|uniref:DUF2955 domain-containing protein n=1 Tax=Gilvimarinus gilvus TaxID=3058038 RepID=A0ABU4S3H1_9GAMM|nr:DUF2955 domain-containing protein [Gilvimarinus sp. SDUM040013]MDO3384784.1 DUF2955 domain-containing protein [Gilvimarinus sp. SDUM040013]MDX6850398.1 DUF2955 domain-containing protein [Gilvimarinus sp. SDUM040013]